MIMRNQKKSVGIDRNEGAGNLSGLTAEPKYQKYKKKLSKGNLGWRLNLGINEKMRCYRNNEQRRS